MNLLPTIINFLAPITTYFIPPTLPPMLPPKQPEQQQLYQHINTNNGNSYEVLASWYGPGFDGNTTASGEIFDQYAMTAASPHLPFGTQLQVTYGSRSVVVTINDRGPYVGDRQLDLSKGAAEQLGIDGVGLVNVTELR